MNKSVPFYANTPDDTHCFQAALKIVLKHFLPERDFTWEELDQNTNKHDGFWTWPATGLLWLDKMGFNVYLIDTFDYQKFSANGQEYLIKKFGPEIAAQQVKFTHDLEDEQRRAKEMTKTFAIEQRVPSNQDIEDLLEKGFLIIANINSRVLNAKEGYVGHFVVVYEHNANELALHDPGLPATEARKVSHKTFEKAWAYPNGGAKNIMAIKYDG